ncbi:NTPase [Algoriphagus lacus]|uniref:NTPase n=1 Tax=Algoriphagus lacus TaxID=2056311 RepID=A0A418PLU7_9BACT|nr:P-loop NTPase fold protein [Algoriphagus lacus]RIW12517.1 NTPase [Algoriphagus lacus]
MISSRHYHLQDPNPLNPFEKCELGREKYAKILTSIMENYADGFVLALNNKWGEGKTEFIRMWKVYLEMEERKFQTIYFNAWEHDFNREPLTALLSELKELKIGKDKNFKSMVKYGARFSKALVPTVLSAFLEKHIDSKTIKEAFNELSEEAVQVFEEEVNGYANKKKGLEEFKKELETYVSEMEKPLVFFIDELDRCNPKYAVEFLEIIKHFFSVPGIVFVLSIDKGNLINSIKGYFGSSEINGNEYLRRFIDLEYSLPSPVLNDYIHYMFQKTGMREFLSAENRRLDQKLSDENITFYDLAYSFLNNSEVNLRQIEKILSHCSIILKTFSVRNYTFPNALLTLLFIKFIKPDFYNLIKDSRLNFQDFIDELFDFVSPKIKKGKDLNFGYIESLLLVLYKNNVANKELDLWEKSEGKEQQEKKLKVTPKLYRKKLISDYSFEYFIEFNEKHYPKGGELHLDYFISRIELMHELQRS